MVKCGDYDLGICSAEIIMAVVSEYSTYTTSFGCGEGLIQIDQVQGECGGDEPINDGKTPICCAPMDPETMKYLGYTADAEIPLFFKGRTGYLVVTTSE